MGIREQGTAEQRTRGRARPPPPMAVTDRTQQQEQTRPSWPGRARGLVKLPSPRCSRHAAVRPFPARATSPAAGGGTAPQAWPAQTQKRPEEPRSGPGGRRHQRHCATHRQAAASSNSAHPEPRPCRASPSPERSQPEGTAAGRGEPRASLPGLREEAGPPPPAPRGLCPAACADGGGGGGGSGGGGAAARVPSPRVRPRGTGRG
jgi:hypothetical protein